MDSSLMKHAEAALEAARREGAEAAETYVSRSRRRRVLVKAGAVEGVDGSESRGLGLRVLRGRRMGFSYTSDFSSDGISRAARRALESAALGRRDEDFRFAAACALPPAPAQRPGFAAVSAEDCVQKTLETCEAAYAAGARVIFAEARYGDYEMETAIASVPALPSMDGFRGEYRVSNCHMGCEAAVSEGGRKQSVYQSDFASSFALLPAVEVGRRAAQMAARKLNPASYPTGRPPVLLDREQVVEILAVLESALSAEEVLKGKSPWREALGTAVAAPCFSLHADPLAEEGPFPVPFDDEGTPARRLPLIRGGQLVNFMHDLRTSAKFSQPPTGSAWRHSHAARPGIGYGQACLEPGTASLEDMLRRTGEGLYINELMGTHTMDAVSGEFSLGASGIAVRGGELAESVAGLALAGNLFDLLKNVRAVGGDFFWSGRGLGAPSLLVEGLTVSGAG